MKQTELEHCLICPRNCGVNRYREVGFCGASAELQINLATLHHGEEPPLSGERGSGAIFFSWCNLRCVYCQNYHISSQGWGQPHSIEALAELMLELQQKEAHNINLVTPTHYSVQIMAALKLARSRGLTLPVIWNSSAYEKEDMLKSLEGLVDIWLPDYKYAHGIYAGKYSQARDYPRVAKSAMQEMFRQSGHLRIDSRGMAVQGMMVRLLVLPNGLSGTRESLRMLADSFGTELHLSLMSQYYPAGKADQYPELKRSITPAEYEEALACALEIGFEKILAQDLAQTPQWTPEFVAENSSPNPLEITVHNPVLENNP